MTTALALHPFQSRGADFLAARRHAYLADEMGCGKTPQAAVALERAGARRALIVAPAIMEDDWCDTLEAFTPNRPPAHRFRSIDKMPATGDVVISYDRAADHRDALLPRRWDALICDEAHFLKSADAERTRAVLNPLYGGRRSLASTAGAVWLLSGTPTPNHVGELWPALRSAGLFNGRYWDFVYQFADVRELRIGPITQRKIGAVKNLSALHDMLKGYMLRRTSEEVLPDLPPLSIGEMEMPGEEITGADPILPVLRKLDADAHDAIEAAIATGDWNMTHVPHLSTIRRLTGLAKAATAADLARLELDCYRDKIVLFGLHSDVLQYLRHSLRDFNPVMLTGAESQKKRRAAIRDFQNDPRARVAIGQNRAAGAGITLTAADRMLVVEPDWTSAGNDQIVKRVHRIGQHQSTNVDFLTLAGSSDAKVLKAVRAKSATNRAIYTAELTG